MAAGCLAVLWALGSIGCGSRGEQPARNGQTTSTPPAAEASRADSAPPASGDRRSLRPVTLPDLAGATPVVRDQVRDRYTLFKQRIDDPSTSTADLGAAYGEMGKLFMAAEYRGEAESCLLNAEALAPGDMRWPYYLGQLYKVQGETSKSAAAFERALKAQPDNVATLVWLGDARLDEAMPDAAEPLFAKAVSLQPRSVAALFGLGRAALARQDYGRAVQSLEQALAVDSNAGMVHYPLAMAYRALGERDKAEAHLRQRGTLQIKPDDPLMEEVAGLLNSPLAYEVGGADALDRGDFAKAAENFRKGIALAPKEPSLHHKLGTALALTGDVRGAVQEFQEAVRLSPKFAKAHYSLGVLYEGAGQHANAVRELGAAVKAEPAYAEARLQLANALRRGGQFEQALREYEQTYTIDPRLAEARFGYAATLVRLNRYAEARDRLAEAMAIYPNEAAFPHALARVLAAAPDDRVRDGRRAVALVQDLLNRLPHGLELLETAAMAQAEVGQYDNAVMWQREAIAAADRSGRHDIAQLITDHLSLYGAHRPCRMPWRAAEPIEFGAAPDLPPEASRS